MVPIELHEAQHSPYWLTWRTTQSILSYMKYNIVLISANEEQHSPYWAKWSTI